MDRDLSRARAVLIGNAVYQHEEIEDLVAARASLAVMAEVLTSSLCGWPADRITTLLDVSAPHELANHMFKAVRDADDVLLVYYVGHGLRTFDGQLALTLGVSVPHPELLSQTAMPYADLARIMRGSTAATKLVILDCCHAELGNRANYVFQGSAQDDLAEAYPVDGLYFIGSSAKNKMAKAPLDGSPTFFTTGLVDVVRTGVPEGPQVLGLDEIFRELRRRLVRAGLPEPVESGMRGARQFRFARNAAAVADETSGLSKALRQLLDSPHPEIRLAGIDILGKLLTDGNPATALSARQELEQIAKGDVSPASGRALALLAEHPVSAHESRTSEQVIPPEPPLNTAETPQPEFPFDLGDLFGKSNDDSGLKDILGGLFSRGGRPGTGQRGADIETEVTITFKESIDGVTIPLRLTSEKPCRTCAGMGAKAGTTPRVCGSCSGTGRTTQEQGGSSPSEPCRTCKGRGLTVDDPCPECRGSGRVDSTRTLHARLPGGVRDGMRIRLKGTGAPGVRGGEAGHLFVVVHVKPHAVFGRDGDNLTVTVPVTYPEAALGADIRVPVLGERPITLKLPAGSANGRTMRVRGKGAPGKEGTKGDLLVTFEVAVPTGLTDVPRHALEMYQEATADHGVRSALLAAGNESKLALFGHDHDDVTLTVPVTFPEAVFGADIRVPVPNGLPVTVKLPAGSASGRTLGVRGRGMPRADGTVSDLLVTFEVAVQAVLKNDRAQYALERFREATADHGVRSGLLAAAEGDG